MGKGILHYFLENLGYSKQMLSIFGWIKFSTKKFEQKLGFSPKKVVFLSKIWRLKPCIMFFYKSYSFSKVISKFYVNKNNFAILTSKNNVFSLTHKYHTGRT